MNIWYMRDNPTFRKLPRDADAAMDVLREEFAAGNNYGMLCGKEGIGVEHAHSTWPEFEPRARKWLAAALAPTAADIEYESWCMTTSPSTQLYSARRSVRCSSSSQGRLIVRAMATVSQYGNDALIRVRIGTPILLTPSLSP